MTAELGALEPRAFGGQTGLEVDRLPNRDQGIGLFQRFDSQSLFGRNCPHMRIKEVPYVNLSRERLVDLKR